MKTFFSGFWTPSSTVVDPSVPYLPLESPSGGGGTTYDVACAEAGALADAQLGLAAFAPAQAEAGAAADSQAGSAAFAPSIAEAGAAAESQAGSAAFAPAISEAGAASDTETASATFVGAQAESVTATDTQTGLATFAGALSESVSAADSQTGLATFAGAVSEGVTVADSETAGAEFAGEVADALTVADTCDATVVPGASASIGGGAARRHKPKRKSRPPAPEPRYVPWLDPYVSWIEIASQGPTTEEPAPTPAPFSAIVGKPGTVPVYPEPVSRETPRWVPTPLVEPSMADLVDRMLSAQAIWEALQRQQIAEAEADDEEALMVLE